MGAQVELATRCFRRIGRELFDRSLDLLQLADRLAKRDGCAVVGRYNIV
jgi:hypothetical protein